MAVMTEDEIQRLNRSEEPLGGEFGTAERLASLRWQYARTYVLRLMVIEGRTTVLYPDRTPEQSKAAAIQSSDSLLSWLEAEIAKYPIGPEVEEFVSVGAPLPRLKEVEVLDGHRLRVWWQSGDLQEVDVSPAIMSHKSFVRLRADDDLFRTAHCDELGDAVLWNDGSALSAVWIEQLVSAAAQRG